MRKMTTSVLIAFVCATLVGAGLHFLFELLPNGITAVFAPVSESLWEHLKIIFWPYLASAMILTHKGEAGCRAPWFLSLLLICGLMLGTGYLYHIVMMGDSLAVDIGIYVICMALGFFLPGILAEPLNGRFREALSFLVAALALFIAIFSFLPPDQILFVDLSGVNTFSTIPY